MTKLIGQKKNALTIFTIIALLLVLQLAFSPVASASLADSDEFMEIMEEIGHDMEHIHEDMHVVAYNIRLLAYSNIVIALFLLIGLIGIFRKK